MTNEPSSNLAWLGQAMAVVSTIGLVALPLFDILAYLDPGIGTAANFDVDDTGALLSAAVPLPFRVAALACSLVALGFSVWALWSLRALFLRYAQGEVFSPRALKLLNNVATALFAGVIVSFAMHAPISLLLSWAQGPGHRAISLAFGTGDLGTLFEAGVVLVIARVMREAGRLADENAKFV